jgi:hypothetical protein
MDYIEISEGLSVRIEAIETVVRNDDGLTCTVKTSWNSYQSTFPYNVLLELIQRKEIKEPERKEELNILRTLGSYAG